MTFLEEYAAYCASNGVPDRLELLLSDINAIQRGKWLPGDDAAKLDGGTVRLPMSTYAPNIMGQEVEATGLGIVQGDPDGHIVPITGTLRPVPWAKVHVAQVQVEMVDEEGAISTLSARRLLTNVLKRFAARGLRPVLATELEFYILRARKKNSTEPRPPYRLPKAQNYDLEVLDRTEHVLNDILTACKVQGLATDTLIAEYGPGQFEINFHHTEDVLVAADTAMLFRRVVRGVVRRHDLEATFMAKPYAEHPGNGMHMHVSVLDEAGHNIFAAKQGVGENLRNAVAGVLHTMPEAQAIFAPHMNSYRRFQPGDFSPSSPNWGLDHRGAGVRLPETDGPGARLEHRICGADVNPYLAIAAVLGGILYGLESAPELPLALDDPAAEPTQPLGHDWRTAVEVFAESEFAADLFGTEFRDIYTTIRFDEIEWLTAEITPVEYRYYLGRL
ncbi:MAG: glutamine synthetase family protein [Rhodobacter sp.]|nr:glutamine synthetase family protein [Rhodobacter sp.]